MNTRSIPLGRMRGVHTPEFALRCRGFLGTSNVTVPLSTTWWFVSTNSISTVCGPGAMPRRMSGLPLASAQCHTVRHRVSSMPEWEAFAFTFG